MSTIRFTFDDLCAFFTSNKPQVMVGLIDTSDAPPNDIHYPHIVIEEDGGAVAGEYHGFNYHGYGQIYGDIFLDVHPAAEPLSFYEPLTTHGPREERQPFQTLIDIEERLYPQQPLGVRPERCRARLHFRNGELYARGPLHDVAFADLLTARPCDDIPAISAAASAGLDVVVPDHGYAVLHFSGGANDFVFKGGKNYKVTVTNKARSFTSQHFQYLYRILDQPPASRLVPVGAVTKSMGNLYVRDWVCMIGWFGKTDYRPLVPHLDW